MSNISDSSTVTISKRGHVVRPFEFDMGLILGVIPTIVRLMGILPGLEGGMLQLRLYLLAIPILVTSCTTSYWRDRTRDAMDVFTCSGGIGFGARAQVGPVSLGLFGGMDLMGLRGGEVFGPGDLGGKGRTMEIDTTIYSLHVFAPEAKARPLLRRKQFVSEGYAGLILPTSLDSEQGPHANWRNTLYNYTQLEVAHGMYGFGRLGLNLAELLDFCLGWACIDIFADDIEGKSSASQYARYVTTRPWHTGVKKEFELDGIKCYVIEPESELSGRPWVWLDTSTPRLLSRMMVAMGYHVAHVDVSHLYGSRMALDRYDAFYRQLTVVCGFSRKPVVVGTLGDGLSALNWAIANPDKVSCLFANNSACDFKSWPGLDKEQEHARQLLQCYDFDLPKARTWDGNPVDQVHRLATVGVPLVVRVAGNEHYIRPQTNGLLLAKRYREAVSAGNNAAILVLKAKGDPADYELNEVNGLVAFFEQVRKGTK